MRKSAISKQVSVISVMATVGMVVLSGCGLRFAATEAQKENAFLHARVCGLAAQTAADENASLPLRALTDLAEKQSAAFVADYGFSELDHTQPSATPGQAQRPAPTSADLEALLREGNAVAEAAKADGARRPDAWALAYGAFDLGIALAGLLGGVWGARAAGFLQKARQKSQALKEIVAGNELFKQLYPEQAAKFKEAQAKQSQTTKTIVTELK